MLALFDVYLALCATGGRERGRRGELHRGREWNGGRDMGHEREGMVRGGWEEGSVWRVLVDL